MPAVAVTEHGNMFSAVTFHDEARKRGIKPILGLRGLRRAGRSHGSIGHAGRDGEPSRAARRRRTRAFTTSSSSSRPATPKASTTSRASTRRCSPQHAQGLIGLSSCLKGEVATGLRTDQTRKALDAAATYRDILGPGNFFLEMQYQGIDEQRVVNTGLLPIARDLGLPLVCTNDVHYLRQTDQHPHDVLLCIGTGKSVSDEKRLKYHGDQFFLKTAEEMAAVFGDYPGGDRATRCASPSAATSSCRRARRTCRTSGAARLHDRDRTSRTSCARASRCGCRGCASSRRAASCAGRSPTTKRGSRTRST